MEPKRLLKRNVCCYANRTEKCEAISTEQNSRVGVQSLAEPYQCVKNC